jgi:hypothetical protein
LGKFGKIWENLGKFGKIQYQNDNQKSSIFFRAVFPSLTVGTPKISLSGYQGLFAADISAPVHMEGNQTCRQPV